MEVLAFHTSSTGMTGDGAGWVVLRRRVDDVVGADDDGHIGVGEVFVDSSISITMS